MQNRSLQRMVSSNLLVRGGDRWWWGKEKINKQVIATRRDSECVLGPWPWSHRQRVDSRVWCWMVSRKGELVTGVVGIRCLAAAVVKEDMAGGYRQELALAGCDVTATARCTEQPKRGRKGPERHKRDRAGSNRDEAQTRVTSFCCVFFLPSRYYGSKVS
ncbi:uncharacterized protein LY79DRAFT_413806 [Colletotrichum navitas]|uniref:Uncharacterized protein n=1 Tax=Colletotrichum navitas TaxID=681940 RepID=A0AAD8PPI5_9PEZI|nr:uncharacterized protein LY79DRAFT_413806 [Colletotrichum navitas]KAK1573395.1 hypothetical protein LY79DRAFT_413806 [Colletotrichum navitas]